jgi:hypothetical protein
MNDLITLDKVQLEQESFLNAIVESKGDNLPAKVEDVLHFFEFSDWKAKAFKSLSDKLSRLDEQSEAYHSALRSGQNWGIAALYAQKRMGEITREMPVKKRSGTTRDDVVVERGLSHGKVDTLSKQGIHYKAYQDAERIASHPEILEATIESAKKHNEIPTKTSVLNRIRQEKAKQTAGKVQTKIDDKIDKQRPKAVADYFDAIKIFKHAIGLAKISAERGKFDPAGKNFLTKKREEINNLMKEVEELV